MLTSDGTYRSEAAIERRKTTRAEKQRQGKRNHTKKAYIERNPEKRAAHITLGNAVRDGKITKPKVCPLCDRETRIIGHHTDYSKPLEVEWMCSKCHHKTHKKR